MKQALTLTIAFLLGISAFAQENWPKNIRAEDGSVISVYEPEPDFIAGDEFTGRAAVSVKTNTNEEPVFGAILFTAGLKNRRSSRNIALESFRITRLKFSDKDEKLNVDAITSEIEGEALGWNWGITEDELKNRIDKHETARADDGFDNTAPRIIYADRPTTLIVLDGEPRVLYDKDLATDKVVNSPNIIFKEKGRWQLYAGGIWYESNNITSGWKINRSLSAKVRSVDEQIKKQEKENNDGNTLTSKPRETNIVVSTEPAELIQTEGSPDYKNVDGTSLLYVSNSPNDIFKDINTQRTYIVIAGRWYSSRGLQGPWEYVPANRLPEDFAKIPEGSDKDAVLANVAGTHAAETAALDAAIPQTARVDRKTASVNVEYDGEPYFTAIRGTSLQLAENANVTVIRENNGNYFALDNGIWFVSDDPYGPWAVANDRPRDVNRIPASSPAYYSRYVDIYDVYPDYVYMGYTPGYLGSYVYGPTVVYGTGYYYRPWFRRMYYPRPLTWGFGFMYDPWWGWNFNFGYNFGYTYVGFWYDRPAYYGWGGGWFGPSRYCPSYRRPYWNGGYYGRGDYYYGRSRYDNRNYYGSATRRERAYYGNTQPANRPPRFGNNLYSDQPGVTSQSVSRVARVYRPGEQTSTRINSRFNDRMQRVPQRAAGNDYSNGSINNRPERNGGLNAGNDSRRPTVTRPEGNSDLRNRYRDRINQPQSGVDQDGQSSNNAPDSRRTQPRVYTPDRESSPRLNNGLERSQRPSVERPSLERPSTPQRTERPSLERPSAPQRSERPSFERPTAPQRSERPSFERPTAPQRSERPSFDRPSPSGRSSSPAVRPPGDRPSGSRPPR